MSDQKSSWSRRKRAAVERFWEKVDRSGPISDHAPELGPCWIWQGSTGCGYGRFCVVAGTCVQAHRYAYELEVGPIPDGRQLDHLCRVKTCVRPSHLEPVTPKENSRRAKAQIRACPQGHPYDDANTYRCLDQRYCRTCHRLRRPKYAARYRFAKAVECPRCGAQVDRGCFGPSGKATGAPHRARVELASLSSQERAQP
jgi:hypothetical protein